MILAATVAGAAAGIAVSSAAPATGSIVAVDNQFEDPVDQDNTVTIAPGGTVTFSYPSGVSAHNVNFEDKQPASCTQTAGSNSGPVPPLPGMPTGQGWVGRCTFDAAGVYSFVCGLHVSMVGSVAVGDSPTNTGPTNTGTGPTNTSTEPGKSPKPPRVKVTRRQRGTVVHGSVTTPAGPSRISIKAFVASRALAQGAKLVRVGSRTKRSTGTGRTAFALRVNAAARRALRRRGRLAVRLRIVVTPPAGKPVSTAAAVTLRRP